MAVSQLLVSQAFISGNGLTAERGLSTPSPVAQRVVGLVGHTKVGVEAMCPTVPAERIDILVTDSRADADEVQKIARLNVDIRIAHLPGPSSSEVAGG